MLLTEKDRLYRKMPLFAKSEPLVSVILPAFNEEEKIAKTIESLKKTAYHNIEFIIINDGSADTTNRVVTKHIAGDARFTFMDNAKNQGKAACLNQGISIARGKFIACMDADTVAEKKIFHKVLPYFENQKVGAVTVTVEVFKSKKFLHKLIDLEFILGLSLFLKVCSFFNCVYVTPGPFSMYRTSTLKKIGGFDKDNIVEDLEIAYRIHKAGYRIDNCLEAKVYTTIPPTFKKIYVQRRRWYSGALLTLIQHRKMMFKNKYGFFSYMMPYNYLVVMLGLTLFFASTYLGLKNLIQLVAHFQYSHFDLWQRLSNIRFDVLNFNTVSLVGFSALAFSIIMLLLGIKMARKSIQKKLRAIIFFPIMYFMYQIFWIGSILVVIRGKKIKWR
jgi:cellulose synthase/poly-beta-1,6-N-acetylglucosamine synthase-like glycosyltransferase